LTQTPPRVNTFFGRDGFCGFALTEKKQKQKLEQEQKQEQSVKNVFVFLPRSMLHLLLGCRALLNFKVFLKNVSLC
jgi:hypothetical protein